MPLIQSEQQYLNMLRGQYDAMKSLYEQLVSTGEIELEGVEMTKATLLRMKAFYDLQDNIKGLLNKRYSASASDYFVETILFYLKVIFERHNSSLTLCSEKQIRPHRGAIRPDISIWRGDEVIAIVECKTQLGWNRKNWEKDFIKREGILESEYPSAKAFLVVMTSNNWPGFGSKNEKVGKQYFALSSIWPKTISDEKVEDVIINPLEGLFRILLGLDSTN